MKKKRIAASIMAAIMTFSAFSSNVIAEETMPDSSLEAVLSGSAMVEETADTAAYTSDDDEDADVEQAPVTAYADGFISGATSGVGSNFAVTETSDGANIKITKNNKGKISNGGDEYAYYAHEVDLSKDFTMSATITVNKYNVGVTVDDTPNQTSFGLIATDKFESGAAQLFLLSYANSKSDTIGRMAVMSRHSGDAAKTMIEDNIEEVPYNNTSSVFDVKIKKSGKVYVISCNGHETTVNDPELFTGESAYFGFFAARNYTEITVSNLDFSVDERSVTEMIVSEPPVKTEYKIGEEPDLTGCKVTVKYSDNSEEVVDATDLIVSDFDSSTKGTKTMYLNKGQMSVGVEYTVLSDEVTSVNIIRAPYINEYSVDMFFKTEGILAEATLNTGETVNLVYKNAYNEATATDEEKRAPKFAFYLDGEEVDDNYVIQEKNVGEKDVEIRLISSDSVDAAGAVATYPVKISDEKLTKLEIISKPITLEYYEGDTFDVSGLTVRAMYSNASGSSYGLLKAADYSVSEPDLTTAGEKTVTISSNQIPDVKTEFKVQVYPKNFIEYRIKEYPVMTVQKGENFDPKGLVVGSYYTSDVIEPIPESQYTFDYSQFDSSKVGTTKVIIKVNGEHGQQDIPLTLTVSEAKEQIWRYYAFGQSANNNSKHTVKFNDDGSVSVTALGGKITGDHDGITYYFTRLNAKNNFTINATIRVDSYITANDDTQRNGQEAFGIMLRDAIPLLSAEDVDENGNPNTSPKLDSVPDVAHAAIDPATGEPVLYRTSSSKIFSANMAILGGYSGTNYPDPKAKNFVKYSNINRINLVGRVGTIDYLLGGGAEKIGPFSLNNEFPYIGREYDLTLKKSGNGLYAKCYDKTNGTTQETYQYFGDYFIDSLDEDNMYIGFFAARNASFTISDIDLHETDPATDIQEYVVSEAVKTPSVNVESAYFTTDDNYNLVLSAGNNYGGTVVIKQDDKIIYRDEYLSKKNTVFPVEMNKDAVNNFTVIYTPNQGDNITSKDDVTINFEVTHRSNAITGKELYAGPNGTPGAAGTREDPLDIQSAIGFVGPGQTVICLGGTYNVRSNIDIPVTQYGFNNRPVTVKADDGADVVIDLQKLHAGISLRADYWIMKGIDVTNAADNQKGFHLGGNYCIIEDCKFYNNGDTGFQISRIGDGGDQIEEWPTNNLVLNCESYNNADPSGINADGYGAKLTVGTGNVFEGCISHHNLDDGWDTYTKLGSGAIGAVTLEGCVSYRQGYKLNEDGTETARSQGGHNGYKMGGENVAVQHYLKDCLAFENGANGVTSNSNPQIKIRNMVCYKNGGAGYLLSSANNKNNFNYDLEGCINYMSSKDTLATVTTDTKYTNAASVPIISESNYFNLGDGYANSLGETVNDGFFKSVDRSVSIKNGKYHQDENGKFILGDYLARVTPYEHKDADRVEISTVDYSGLVTEATTSDATEATTGSSEVTTKKSGGNGGGGGGGGGGNTGKNTSKSGSSSSLSSSTTEAQEEKTTEKHEYVTEPTTIATDNNMFNDIADKPWAAEAINTLASKGMINGVGAGKFDPNANCKRADFAIMLVNVLGITGTASDNFDDVEESKYYYNYVGLAKQAGIVNGYGNGKFGPENYCTRAELMVMVANALAVNGADISADESVLDKFSDAADIPVWARPYVAYLVSEGIVSGSDGKINANVNITRAEVAVIMYKLVTLTEEEVVETVEEEPAEEPAEADEEVTEEADLESSEEEKTETAE